MFTAIRALAVALVIATTVQAQSVPPPATVSPPMSAQPPAAAATAAAPAAAAATETSSTPGRKQWRAPSSGGVRRASNNEPFDSSFSGGPFDRAQPDHSKAGSGQPLESVPQVNRQPIARVTRGTGTLPSDAGQEWRDYDIAPYTARVTTTNRPEQAIVDWILRETGYEAWHGEPLGLLSANRRTLRVYHTPQMHARVSEVVDRFVNSQAESQAFGMHVITMGSPNWRAKAHAMLRPVTVQSPGAAAWLVAKEDAAVLLADLRKRTDFREHSSPHLLVNNGQSSVITTTRPRNYVRNVATRPGAWPGFEPELGQIEEGFSLQFDPLLSLDGRSIDALIKCNVDQVERMIPVVLDVPTAVAPRQRTKIEVPQVTSCRLHERFRWPTDQVLLISLGVVASPSAKAVNPITAALPMGLSSRADLLVLVESKGRVTGGAPAAAATTTARRDVNNYRGRY